MICGPSSPRCTPPRRHGVSFDPTVSIDSPAEALTVAETIMQMSTVGLGSGADQVSDGGIWESQAAGPLAAFLTPHPPPHPSTATASGMSWVLTAVDNIDPEKFDTPGWAQAAALCHKHKVLALGMMRILEMDARQRDSVAITMRKAITPWLRTALNTADVLPPFTPDFLDKPDATLFVLAPADGTVAGSAVTLLDSLVRWRNKTASREQMHRLLMIIDELPNTAPVPACGASSAKPPAWASILLPPCRHRISWRSPDRRAYANELRGDLPGGSHHARRPRGGTAHRRRAVVGADQPPRPEFRPKRLPQDDQSGSGWGPAVAGVAPTRIGSTRDC